MGMSSFGRVRGLRTTYAHGRPPNSVSVPNESQSGNDMPAARNLPPRVRLPRRFGSCCQTLTAADACATHAGTLLAQARPRVPLLVAAQNAYALTTGDRALNRVATPPRQGPGGGLYLYSTRCHAGVRVRCPHWRPPTVGAASRHDVKNDEDIYVRTY